MKIRNIKIDKDTVFYKTLKEMRLDPKVREMQQFSHHKCTDTYTHCLHVAEYSYLMAKKYHIKIDEKSLAIGAMLHDFYLYNFRDEEGIKGYEHGIHHPGWALINAKNYFTLNPKEENIIASHMWPLTFRKIPHSKEATLVCIADKVCAFNEMVRGNARKEQDGDNEIEKSKSKNNTIEPD